MFRWRVIISCMSGSNNRATRRKVLKASALTGTLFGAGPVAAVSKQNRKQAQNEKYDRIREQAARIAEKHGNKARKRFLERMGHGYTSVAFGLSIPHGKSHESDEVTVQWDTDEDGTRCIDTSNCANSETDVRGFMSLINFDDSDRWDVELDVRYYYSRWYDGYSCDNVWFYDGPHSPQDGISVSWDTDEWYTYYKDTQDSVFSDNYATWDGVASNDGVGFIADSKDYCKNQPMTEDSPKNDGCDGANTGTENTFEWSSYLTVGCRLKKGQEWTKDSWLAGEYIYQYNNSDYSFDLSISYPWSVTIDPNTSVDVKRIHTNQEYDGDDLEVHPEEAI